MGVLIIGAIVGIIIGALVLMLATKLVEKFTPSFGKAVVVVIVGAVASFIVRILSCQRRVGSKFFFRPAQHFW